jgi:two-component system, LytTR family, response regulator LytT
MENRNKKILIAEDEIIIAEFISDLLYEMGFSQICMAHDYESIIQLIISEKPDLVLLDIRMDDQLVGLTIGEHLFSEYHIPFIYITANSEYSIMEKAVLTKPLGYITKPIRPSDLFAMVSIALSPAIVETEMLTFKDGYSVVRLNLNDIFYIQSDGNYLTIFSKDKKYVIRQTLEWIHDQLDKSIFLRGHRSYIINVKKVEKLGNRSVIINHQELPISRLNWNEIRAQFLV